MSKFTPGPWKAVNYGPHWNNDQIVNWTIHYGDDEEHIVDHVYDEADARLIAAAPEMYDALSALLDALDANGSCQYERLREEGRAALAKAAGNDG